MANAIGETRAVARQGSSRHDEMDGWPGGWMDSRVGDGAKTNEACTCMLRHCIYCDRLADGDRSWGVGLRALLGTVSQGKELGWTHLELGRLSIH